MSSDRKPLRGHPSPLTRRCSEASTACTFSEASCHELYVGPTPARLRAQAHCLPGCSSPWHGHLAHPHCKGSGAACAAADATAKRVGHLTHHHFLLRVAYLGAIIGSTCHTLALLPSTSRLS